MVQAVTRAEVETLMRDGMILHVGPARVKLVELMRLRFKEDGPPRESIDVPIAVFEAIKSQMRPLTRKGIPPPSQRPKSGSFGWKMGWEDYQLPNPGDGAYWMYYQ